MPDTSRLSRGAALAALVSLVAVSCGTETIELLPLVPNGGTAGGVIAGDGGTGAIGATSGNAGEPPGGSQSGGMGGQPFGGTGGSFGGCTGFGCGGSGDGSGGTGGPVCNGGFGPCTPCLSDEQCGDWHCSKLLGNVCVACTDSSHCKSGLRCDLPVGRCAPSCDANLGCRDNRVCDPQFLTCVDCTDDEQCEMDDNPDTSFCSFRRCVECTRDDDCEGSKHELCVNGRCADCFGDKDCEFDEQCNAAGYCE
jgi:hypothetical protein